MKKSRYEIYILVFVGILFLMYGCFDIYRLFMNKSDGTALVFIFLISSVFFIFAKYLYVFSCDKEKEQEIINNGRKILANYENIVICSDDSDFQICKIVCNYVDPITNILYKFYSEQIYYKSSEILSAITQMQKYEFLICCDENDYNKYVMDISDLTKWLDNNIDYND